MDKKYAEKIAKGFLSLLQGKEQKAIKAESERQYIIAHILNDQLPATTRTEWLKTASLRLKHFLIKEATDFNNRYPDDEMLIQDWIDLLNAVRAQLYKGNK